MGLSVTRSEHLGETATRTAWGGLNVKASILSKYIDIISAINDIPEI